MVYFFSSSSATCVSLLKAGFPLDSNAVGSCFIVPSICLTIITLIQLTSNRIIDMVVQKSPSCYLFLFVPSALSSLSFCLFSGKILKSHFISTTALLAVPHFIFLLAAPKFIIYVP